MQRSTLRHAHYRLKMYFSEAAPTDTNVTTGITLPTHIRTPLALSEHAAQADKSRTQYPRKYDGYVQR